MFYTAAIGKTLGIEDDILFDNYCDALEMTAEYNPLRIAHFVKFPISSEKLKPHSRH